ncbi:MAG: hypothetical protein HZA06_02060 [Nitrospirae bacterium]|nr:hypothetical protein [Nitrospirota bacterium]
MERGIGADKLKAVIRSLDTAARKAGIKKLKVIVCGGLAVIAYGMTDRQTLDIDAEVDADFRVIEKLKKNLKLPAELTTDISRWSMVDIPPGYRERAVPLNIVETKNIEVFFLSPIDLIISKLRVFRDKDIEDAVFLVRKFKIKKGDILRASRQAIEASPPSTELLRFKKTLQHFIKLAYS